MNITSMKDLVTLRNDRNVSQQQLASALGTFQSAIARIESGRVKPTLAFAIRYLDALGYTLTIKEKENE